MAWQVWGSCKPIWNAQLLCTKHYRYDFIVLHDRSNITDSQFLDVSVPSTWWGYQLTKTVQNGGPHAISEILHIEYRIVCCIETYLIHMYHISKCSKCNWNRYIEGFCIWNMHFYINGLSPNIVYVIFMSWLLMAIYFLLLNYWLFIFCAVFISYLMVINSKKYKSKYPNTIWWIMPCIMSELWKNQIAINPKCCLIWHRLIWKAVLVTWHPRSDLGR